MGYSAAILESLAELSGLHVHAIYRDTDSIRGYVPKDTTRVRFLPRSHFDAFKLSQLFQQLSPKMLYVSGWTDDDYLQVCKVAKQQPIPVVTGMDNQWRGTLRQRAACYIARWRIHPYFSHIQVAGIRQYEYARRLGFREEQILLEEYSADLALFASPLSTPSKDHTDRQPDRRPVFVFAGRFDPVKGLDVLMQAWQTFVADDRFSDWRLRLIGKGQIDDRWNSIDRVEIVEYLPPEQLAANLQTCSVFVLPSRREPWGVVVHENAARGLPLILSDACGAATQFLIHRYNGYRFRSGDSSDLAAAMKWIALQSDGRREELGRRSQLLAQRITPETAAANLLSVLA